MKITKCDKCGKEIKYATYSITIKLGIEQWDCLGYEFCSLKCIKNGLKLVLRDIEKWEKE